MRLHLQALTPCLGLAAALAAAETTVAQEGAVVTERSGTVELAPGPFELRVAGPGRFLALGREAADDLADGSVILKLAGTGGAWEPDLGDVPTALETDRAEAKSWSCRLDDAELGFTPAQLAALAEAARRHGVAQPGTLFAFRMYPVSYGSATAVAITAVEGAPPGAAGPLQVYVLEPLAAEADRGLPATPYRVHRLQLVFAAAPREAPR